VKNSTFWLYDKDDNSRSSNHFAGINLIVIYQVLDGL